VIIDIKILDQFRPFFDTSLREVCAKSGRASGKSYGAAAWQLARSYDTTQHRVLPCVREIQKSIAVSAYPLLQERAEFYGVYKDFRFLRDKIINKWTSSVFLFFGLKDETARNSFKSVQGITDLWVEEAHSLSDESLRVLLPTVREKGSRIIYTCNPTPDFSSAVEKRFQDDKMPPNSVCFATNWRDNPFLPVEYKQVIEYDYKTDEELGKHIWDGERLSVGYKQAVFPSAWVDKIFEFSAKISHVNKSNYRHRVTFSSQWQPIYFGGFDLADQGDDTNALVLVSGNVVDYIDEWRAQFTGDSVFKVHNVCEEMRVQRVDYDATGMGSSARSDFAKYAQNYAAVPFMAGGRAEGYDRNCLPKITNGQFFKNKKAQSYWALRLAMERTIKAIDESDGMRHDMFNYSPANHYLLFSPDVISKCGDKLKQELKQIEYKHDEGKLSVDKKPNGTKSPNLVDALVMAYSYRIDRGLAL